MAQTFRRDEARARTFNTMPSYFPFVANIVKRKERFQCNPEPHAMKCSAAQESRRRNDLDCPLKRVQPPAMPT